jgi:hypothetical protein
MSDIPRIISSIDEISAPPAPVVNPQPIAMPAEPFDGQSDGGLIPWLWVLAWLAGWALLVAIAAWWIGEVSPREMWMWVLIWAVPGLVVSGLLTRAAAQATERASNVARLSRARREIAQLEEQLQTSTQSMFAATQTLTEATEVLLEQVDTSRDDLRNQISSAQSLTDSLRAQTEGLVSAQQGFTQSLKRDLTPPSTATHATDFEAESLPPLNLRPAPEEETSETPLLKLRPAPEVEESFKTAAPVKKTIEMEAQAATTHPPDAPAALATPASKDWKWSDMLRTVDEVIPPSDSGDEVIAALKAAGLSPDVLMDEGNAVDAINIWGTSGLPAMGQLLSIRFDEPAREMQAKLMAEPKLFHAFQRFSNERASRLDPADRDVRLKDARTEAGRAWLFVQAVLAL